MPEDRKPIAYGCARASTSKQVLTLEAQQNNIARYYDWKLKDKYLWGGCYSDPATTSHTAFVDRPKAGALHRLMQSGDCVVVANLDRAFRSPLDFMLTFSDWERRGIQLHLLDLNIDTSTAIGKVITHMMVAMAEWERTRIGERTKEVMKVLIEKHRARNPGWKHWSAYKWGWRYDKGIKRHVPCTKTREFGELIVRLHDQEKMTWEQIYFYCLQHRITVSYRNYLGRFVKNAEPGVRFICRSYRESKALKAQENGS